MGACGRVSSRWGEVADAFAPRYRQHRREGMDASQDPQNASEGCRTQEDAEEHPQDFTIGKIIWFLLILLCYHFRTMLSLAGIRSGGAVGFHSRSSYWGCSTLLTLATAAMRRWFPVRLLRF